MLKWLEKLQSAVLFAFCLLLVSQIPEARSEPAVSFEISDIKTAIADNTLTYNIVGSAPPVYTVSERFTPFRVVVDVAGGAFGKDLAAAASKLPENGFSQLTVTELKGQDPAVMRFEFTLADSHDYTVTTKDSSLLISLHPADAKNTAKAANTLKGLLTLKDFKISFFITCRIVWLCNFYFFFTIIKRYCYNRHISF